MRIGIFGYGSVGIAAEELCENGSDIELMGIVSARAGQIDKRGRAEIYPVDRLADLCRHVDVMLVCAGSSVGLTDKVVRIASYVNTVDVYDRHSDIAAHKQAVGEVCNARGTVSVVSTGWDPGLLSVIRIYCKAILGDAVITTFWGEGVSRGHTEALKKIDGVKGAVQITVPDGGAVKLAERGAEVSNERRHIRRCFVCAEEKERDRIKDAIPKINDYFKGQRVEIIFTEKERIMELEKSEGHRGRVLAVNDHGEMLDLKLSMSSNPRLTAATQLAYAKAALRLAAEGKYGAYTPDMIAPYLLFDAAEKDYINLI